MADTMSSSDDEQPSAPHGSDDVADEATMTHDAHEMVGR